MNREELKALGLTDDQIDKVMASHGKALNATKEKADKVDGLESQIADYKTQLKSRDDQLEELKKVDAEGLQQKIQDLQKVNEDKEKEWQGKLDKQAFDFALQKAISGAKPKTENSAKAIIALLDTEKIKLDGEKLLNLDDQLEALKKSDAHLFEEEQQNNGKPTFMTGQHGAGGGSGDPSNLQEALAQHFSQQQ